MKARILLADDDKVFCNLVSRVLKRNEYEVTSVNSVEEAQKALQSSNYDIMMLDMCFPALSDGFGLLEEVRQQWPRMLVLMISGSGHIPDAVQAIKYGAADFIEKPPEPEHLLLRLNALSGHLLREKQLKQARVAAIGMVGVSREMNAVFDGIIQASRFDNPVLITGETGVGKELAAHAIHRLSDYGDRNMLSINCASVPRELFEAELFGYTQGAFTGAVKEHKGFFEYAHNTSFFLDEVGELPLELQAKILRVISEGEMQKIGGDIRPVRTRIISASNRDLEQAVEQGTFRGDLFYRLNAIHIHIPPLRTRREDIPGLAQYFLNDFCSKQSITPKFLTPEAQSWLSQRKWKGNARELKHCVERAVIFTTSDYLDVVDFTTAETSVRKNYSGERHLSMAEMVKAYEKQLIEFYLKENNYNVSQTAKHLDTDRSNLFKKIKQLNILLPQQDQ
ncbi:MAG: Transcriptional regulatory protein ZraR [Candidatus Cloacimonetes bacterium ADurb.Bin088]|jgi:DNA-binding NtrC family response regulator|nr:MAG: Transcriptional regulatory protein ZraR [Candidatus Cloacimonetes bacterium ADurb.Bin088]